MLVGLAEVKPDRMIRRYVATALGRSAETAVGVEEARHLVMATAERLGVSPRELDYAIWSYQTAHRSSASSDAGRVQQTRTRPSGGSSSGSSV